MIFQAPVVKREDNFIQWISSCPADKMYFNNKLIHFISWIATYPLDKVMIIFSLKKQGLVYRCYIQRTYIFSFRFLKDGAYYCYCAYVLRILRYSDFLWVVPANTGIFLRGLKLCRESRTKQVLLVSIKKIGGNHAFFRDYKASIWKKNAIHCFVFYCF